METKSSNATDDIVYLTPRANSVYKRVLPMLDGLTFNEIADLTTAIKELAESCCVLGKNETRESEPLKKPANAEEAKALTETLMAEVKAKLATVGVSIDVDHMAFRSPFTDLLQELIRQNHKAGGPMFDGLFGRKKQAFE